MLEMPNTLITKSKTDHRQTKITLHNGKVVTVDRGMQRTIKHLNRLGYDTRYSCKNNRGRGYVQINDPGKKSFAKLKKLPKDKYEVESSYFRSRGKAGERRAAYVNFKTGPIGRWQFRRDVSRVSKMYPADIRRK